MTANPNYKGIAAAGAGMRSQLLVGGLLVAGMGLVFIVTQLPLIYFWGYPFAVGGAVMALAAPLLPEREGPVQPPDGFRFCVYCSKLVPDGEPTCEYCGGRQPAEVTA